jgi:glycerol-3-phosphate dehydrogenase
MKTYDAIVIGSGISGACTARELAKYRLRTAVLEKSHDFCAGASRSNSATVHSGHDAAYGSLKAYYNVKGNAMYGRLCEELSVPFVRNGTIVFAATEADMAEVRRLKANADLNGVPGVRVINREEMNRLEGAEWGDEVIGALYAPTGGMVCPYSLVFALCENAAAAGTEFFRNCGVGQIERGDGGYFLHTAGETFFARYVFNCAGVHADTMNNFVSAHRIRIIPRKGSHIILDRKLAPYVKATLCQTPSILPGGGHTKGMGIMPTVDGTVILGCEAREVADKEDTSSTREGTDDILNYFKENWRHFPIARAFPEFPQKYVIGIFAGSRPHPDTDDFILGEPEDAPGFFNLAGIESPGVTAAPAIAADLVSGAAEKYGFLRNPDFDPIRKVPKPFRNMSAAERAEAIAKDPDYGQIICRCEQVTLAEVLRAMEGPLGARSVTGVKMRVRAGMGRCQGGFCSPEVVRILSERLHVPMTEVLQAGKDSNVLLDEVGVPHGKEA